MEEKVIGYDVREMWYKEPTDFRMGSKLAKMLSANRGLWSSIFNDGTCPDIVGKDREERSFGVIEFPPESRVGINWPLWSDLADLRNYLEAYRCAEGRPAWLVAITIRAEDLESKSRALESMGWPRDTEWPERLEANPDGIQKDWAFVGYDLTNVFSDSMITASLSPQADAQGVAELTSELNEYLLFPGIEKAVEFKTRWDISPAGEQTPHPVYGIWRIEEIRYRSLYGNW
jgi:hypothetical protein